MILQVRRVRRVVRRESLSLRRVCLLLGGLRLLRNRLRLLSMHRTTSNQYIAYIYLIMNTNFIQLLQSIIQILQLRSLVH